MQKVFINQYKRHDIFACNHSAHHRFGGAVSTYYILEEKRCYPEGCINFIWRCRLLNKGHACPKKFTHVGRKCFSCRQFYEDKYIQQPRLMVSPQDFRNYLREKEDFDHWIDQHEGRSVQIDAKLVSIKPDIVACFRGPRRNFRLNGWILVFDMVYINYDLFNDAAFAWISIKTQEKLSFSTGHRFEARARFTFQRGRLIFNHLHNIEIVEQGESPAPDPSRILVAAETATEFPVQPDKCIRCPEGILVEKGIPQDTKGASHRRLVCLRGQKNAADCIHHLEPLLNSAE